MAVSPDAVTMGTAHYDGEIQLWDIETAEALLSMTTAEVVEDIDFSPDGRLLVSGGSYQNQNVRLWDVSTGALLRTLEGHTDGVTQVLFSPQGHYLVSASYNGQLILWGLRQ
jgi:WD40 repeat protein